MFDESILKNDEKAVFALRALYRRHGYHQYKMSKFEEYDLYSDNKDFLVSDGVITFNDTNGKLLALKPDVTLSIIKNSKDAAGEVQRVYYNENVYRISDSSHTYKEIMQTGLECIGDLTDADVHEVVRLAMESLATVSESFVLDLCDVGLVYALLADYAVSPADQKAVVRMIAEKNAGALKQLCTEKQFDALKTMVKNYSSAEETFSALETVCLSEASQALLNKLKEIYRFAAVGTGGEKIRIDFSVIDPSGYYSGVVFKGYVGGIASRVLSGGRYDTLMRKMGRTAGAIGFAVYLDTLERFEEKQEAAEKTFVNVALPKGRLGEKVYAMFERSGYECPAIKENSRKLIFENPEQGIRYFWVKPSDVSIYVERGAADIGVAGKDILLEYTPNVYELLDLNIGKCRMAVAAKKDFTDDTSRTLRVATKFSNIAKEFYAEKCRDIELIHLNGSIELAPILGLSDVIVDIVETGKTLLENDLTPIETVVPISARLIANSASYKFKAEKIEKIKKALLQCVEEMTDD